MGIEHPVPLMQPRIWQDRYADRIQEFTIGIPVLSYSRLHQRHWMFYAHHGGILSSVYQPMGRRRWPVECLARQRVFNKWADHGSLEFGVGRISWTKSFKMHISILVTNCFTEILLLYHAIFENPCRVPITVDFAKLRTQAPNKEQRGYVCLYDTCVYGIEMKHAEIWNTC